MTPKGFEASNEEITPVLKNPYSSQDIAFPETIMMPGGEMSKRNFIKQYRDRNTILIYVWNFINARRI